MQTLADVGGYDTLIFLLETYPIDANGTLLSSLFSEDGTYTLFAPNNDAFAALYATVGVSKASDVSPAIIVSLLTYHGAGTIIDEITPGASIATVQGEAIVVNQDNPDADGSEGSPEDGTLLTGSNTKGIVVADEPIMASNGVIWDVGTVLIPPGTGDLLASILGTNAASLLISNTFSAMGGALQASEVFAVTNELPSLIDYLANPEVISTVFAVPNAVFEAAGLSVETFSGEDWYGILSHHVISAAAALKATDDASNVLDAATLTGGLFDEGKIVDGMIGMDDGSGGIVFVPLYIKYDADLAGQFGGGTGVLIDSDLDFAMGMSADSAGFWNAEVLFPDAVTNVNGIIHVIAGFLTPMKPEAPENPMEGTWTLAPVAGALAVGPATDDLSWWSSDAAAVTTRDCHFDDQYVFDAGTMSTNDAGEEIWSGEYTILTDGSTWLEPGQEGVDAEGCGTPVAPHDESNAPFTYEVNVDAETVTLYGVGAYFGLAKATNEGELWNSQTGEVLLDANTITSRTYALAGGDDDPDHHATFQVIYPGGVWQFILANADHEGGDGNGGGDGTGGGDGGGPNSQELVQNGGFEGGAEFWNSDSTKIAYEYYDVNVETAGNPYDVNLSQIMTLDTATSYDLTFKARSTQSRFMLAGLGLNADPYHATTDTAQLTTDWQTFTYTIVTTTTAGISFGDANSRVLFDMGSDVGVVHIDDVSVKKTGGDGTELVTNGDFSAGAENWVNAEGKIQAYHSVNVETATANVYDVNLSQIMTLAPATAYQVSFMARASVARTMVAGLGLNSGDYHASTVTVDLTTEWQPFTYTITTTTEGGVDFGDDNSRVLFDMGVAVGAVHIDNVSVIKAQ
ncbi:fasciclin domain-containing protein [Cyclobacteriaceae bacterium]|nr:fasciclin domain-containing protein [Cyclobacteriaceae bacterium]